MRFEAPELDDDDLVLPNGAGHGPLGPSRLRLAQWQSLATRLARGDTIERLAARQGLVVLRGEVRAAGVSDAEVRQRVRSGRWSVPRRGVLCPFPAAEDPVGTSWTNGYGDRPEMAACAAALAYPRTVISFASAATLHCLPLLGPKQPPTLTAGRNSRATALDSIRVHATAMTRDEVDRWFGAPFTSVARTVIDLARAGGVPQGLVAADAALHERLTTMNELKRVLRRQAGWPGVVAARRAVELADGRAESPLESLTRLCVIDAGLPVPEPQVWVDADGHRYRVDLLWPDYRVVLEADGMSKYRAGFEVVTAEKRRHERLDTAGYRVIRVTWDDVVNHSAETATRIRTALARNGYRP